MFNYDENIEEIYNEILEHSEDEALKYVTNIYEETENKDALAFIANSHLVYGEYEEAIELADKAIEKDCNYKAYSYIVKAEAQLELGLYAESRRTYEKVLAIDEDNYKALLFLIELDIREEFFQTAIDRCVEFLDSKPEDNEKIGEIQSILGWTYLVDLDNKDKAYNAFKDAINNNNNLSRAHTGMAVLLVGEGKYLEAIEFFNKGIELDSLDGENYLGLAVCYKALEEFENVEDLLLKADELEQSDSRILMELGYEALRQEKKDIAIEYFKEVLWLNPESLGIRELIESLINEENKEK